MKHPEAIDTYLAPNGWLLKWRTINHIGDLTLYDAEGQRQMATSGVVTQATFDRAVKELKERALKELQMPLFVLDTDGQKAYTENVETVG